jgi:hypothetical protein
VYCTAAMVDAAAMVKTPSATAVRLPLVPAGPEDQMSESDRTGCSYRETVARMVGSRVEGRVNRGGGKVGDWNKGVRGVTRLLYR